MSSWSAVFVCNISKVIDATTLLVVGVQFLWFVGFFIVTRVYHSTLRVLISLQNIRCLWVSRERQSVYGCSRYDAYMQAKESWLSENVVFCL